MISFKYRSLVKKVKIKTHQKLDERMSQWLQKLFIFKYPIIGFKVSEKKYYDIDSFYSNIDKFYGQLVEIIQGYADQQQHQISFTSDNLNSSSLLKNNYNYNTNNNNNNNNYHQPVEIIPKGTSSDQPQQHALKNPSIQKHESFVVVTDEKAFRRRLINNKDISILFEVYVGHRAQILQKGNIFLSKFSYPFQINFYLLNISEGGNFSIYIGTQLLITLPLSINYDKQILRILNRYKTTISNKQQNNVLINRLNYQQIDDDAPSFTTYHLQQRFNQDMCLDYLLKMQKQNLLHNHQYEKLCEKCQDNFNQFYRLFCQGTIDNDYENFKNQVLQKVDNNLEMLLNNVDEMDLSRPISRQEQRKALIKKSIPTTQIVKVENYFEIFDQLKYNFNYNQIQDIHNLLLNQENDICQLFQKYQMKNNTQQQLISSLHLLVNRPISRCDQRLHKIDRYPKQKDNPSNNTNTIIDQNNKVKMALTISDKPSKQQAPVFGSIHKDQLFSPIKYMSDIESNYKQAQKRLSTKMDLFAPQQYGLLYNFLHNRDDSILNLIQQIQWHGQINTSLNRLKIFLHEKMNQILSSHFSADDLNQLASLRSTTTINCIFDNFKFQCDINRFISELKDYLNKNKPICVDLGLKKSPSQKILENSKSNRLSRYALRKYSDEKQKQKHDFSPKESQISLYQKQTEEAIMRLNFMKNPWRQQFEEMLQDYNFTEQKKQQFIRKAFKQGNPTVFLWVRNYLQHKNQIVSLKDFKNQLIFHDYDNYMLSMVPRFSQLFKRYVEQKQITQKVCKWCIVEFMECNINILSAFELYIYLKNQQDFIENIILIFELQNNNMQFYRIYLQRMQILLRNLVVNDQVSIEMFRIGADKIKAICQLYYMNGDLEDLLETLHIMYTIQNEKRNLKVINIYFQDNFNSAFMYQSQNKWAKDISIEFKRLLDIDLQEKQINFQKIRQLNFYYHKNRLSICYLNNIDLIDNCLPNQEQFKEIWMKKFNQANIKQFVQINTTDLVNTMRIDYLQYQALIKILYDCKEIHYKQLNPEILNQCLQQLRHGIILNPNAKQQQIISYIVTNSINVIYLQESGMIEWDKFLPQNYQCVTHNNCSIIYNSNNIGVMKNSLMQIYANKLNINQQCAWLFSDRHYLLISIILNSQQQYKLLLEAVQNLLQDHPLLKIIIGCYTNNYHLPFNSQFLYCYPQEQQQYSNRHLKTFLQTDCSKISESIKSHILSNRIITNTVRQTIEQKYDKDIIIPNEQHPYSQFIIQGNIK